MRDGEGGSLRSWRVWKSRGNKRAVSKKGGFGECALVPVFGAGEHPCAPSFRFLVPGNIRMYPRPVFGTGAHPPKPAFWKPPFCEPPRKHKPDTPRFLKYSRFSLANLILAWNFIPAIPISTWRIPHNNGALLKAVCSYLGARARALKLLSAHLWSPKSATRASLPATTTRQICAQFMVVKPESRSSSDHSAKARKHMFHCAAQGGAQKGIGKIKKRPKSDEKVTKRGPKTRKRYPKSDRKRKWGINPFRLQLEVLEVPRFNLDTTTVTGTERSERTFSTWIQTPEAVH